MMSSQHSNFTVTQSGLHVSVEYPFLGASPDGIVSCSCCGTGLLEIKCPFKYRDVRVTDIRDKAFCLQQNNAGKLELSRSHNYYIQVQGQLAVCKKQYSDFVCWTKHGIHVECIQVDSDLVSSLLPKLTRFFSRYLLPELLTNKLKSTGVPYDPIADPDESDCEEGIYCSCREVAYGPMVACDDPDCQYEWFHFDCVGLTEEPSGYWFCDTCTNR